MKKILIIFLLNPWLAMACSGYVIGFKGLNDSFDNSAFNEYVKNKYGKDFTSLYE